MKDVKQVLIVRRDLKMRKGKIAAQCAHASVMSLMHYNVPGEKNDIAGHKTQFLKILLNQAEQEWLSGLQTKICVSVDSEEELLRVYEEAHEAGIKVSLVTDAGLTEFNGVPTKTVVAIGPDYSDKIDPITKDLKLL